MLLEIILSILIGIIAGTITGLIPGIHINLLGVLLLSLYNFFPYPIYFVCFISSTAITHTFLDFIPSVFLGCPDTDTELGILPGHKLLKKGEGYQAIMLTAYGSIVAIILLLIISFPAIFLMKKIQNAIPILIPGLLILASMFLISTENKRTKATFIFLISGILGYFTLNSQIIFNQIISQPFLPLLTGLFGASTLIKSIKEKTFIPEQKIENPKINSTKPFLSALLTSPICSFLPGLGSGQAAVIANSFAKTDTKNFLILLGTTNTLVMGFSFISLYAISKTRTGAALTIKEILGTLSFPHLILILFVVAISGLISFFLTKKLAKYFSKNINKFSYRTISIITLIILFLIVLIFSGFKGILILTLSTILGIYTINQNLKRTLMMGCLMIPTFILYLF